MLKSYGFARRLAGIEAEVEAHKGQVSTKGLDNGNTGKIGVNQVAKHNLIKGSNVNSNKRI